MPVQPVPEGYHTITPYLVVTDVTRTIDFLEKAFHATIIHRMLRPDGSIGHAELQIGDSKIMLGAARDRFAAQLSVLYLYLSDVDEVYRRALAAGATSISEPTDQFYGDRKCGVADSSGNQWWIATHVEDVSAEELERRSGMQFSTTS